MSNFLDDIVSSLDPDFVFLNKIDNSKINRFIKTVGWVHSIRLHKNEQFIDIRYADRILQVVVISDAILKVTTDSYIKVAGILKQRSPDTINHKHPLGNVEFFADSFEVLSLMDTKVPFLPKTQETNISMDDKLKFRHLYLRKKYEDFKQISKFYHFLRTIFQENGFIELSLPLLSNTTPEGARDFVVPSRLHPGKFYALAQSPQQYKQCAMVGGICRYFSLPICFRDEDPRGDRLYGEFRQVDYEMTLPPVEKEKQLNILIKFVAKIFEDACNFFDRTFNFYTNIEFKEAIRKYGTDKPNLHLARLGYRYHIIEAIESSYISAIEIPEQFAQLFEFAKAKKLIKNLFLINTTKADLQGTIKKFAEKWPTELTGVFLGTSNTDLDSTFREIANIYAYISSLHEQPTHLHAIVVTSFPVFEIDVQGNKVFAHNPFCAFKEDSEEVTSYQYDLVVNGVEIGSGSIRENRAHVIHQNFAQIYSTAEVDMYFKGIIDVYQTGGIPEHGGFAFGLDRLISILKRQHIKDVVPFPLLSTGVDAMTLAPSSISKIQEKELHIKIIS